MPSNFRRLALIGAGAAKNVSREVLRRYDTIEALNDRHFALAILAAFALHMLAAYVWYLAPKEQVIDVPVRALNIKLGDGDTPQDMPVPQPATGNKARVEETISRLIQAPQEKAESARPKKIVEAKIEKKAPAKKAEKKKEAPTKKFDMRTEGVKEAAPVTPVVARQFVRDLAPPAAASSTSSAQGNSNAKDAEMISRYEQLISLWIQKFKQYPEEARAQGAQGETTVRIRIDRRGNVRYWALENTTGSQILDRAAIDMIRRANPVPAVPADYPPGDVLEFLIPVNFQLQ